MPSEPPVQLGKRDGQQGFECVVLFFSDDGDLSIVFRLSRTSDNSQINADDIIPLGTGVKGVVLVEASGFPSLDVHLQSVTASSDTAGSDSFALITDG